MQKYRVVFARSYDLEAETQAEAEEQACDLLEQDLADASGNIHNVLGMNSGEMEEEQP